MTGASWSLLLTAVLGWLEPFGVASPTNHAAQLSSSAAPSAGGPTALPGKTIDFAYDGADVKNPKAAYVGRAFVHDRVLARGASKKAPLVVFLHGLNKELIPHRWMGGGNEGDVRRIVVELVERGAIEPPILAGPGSVVPEAVSRGASFVAFDLDRFVELTRDALNGTATIDEHRVVVAGHSGAGCSAKGGLASVPRARSAPLAVLAIDTCMPGALAEALGAAPPQTHVVVTWQTASWSREFEHFRRVFGASAKAHPAAEGTLRELDHLPARPRAHDATVAQTFDKWLPRILPPPPASP